MRLIDADKIVYSWQIDADGNEHDGVTLQSIIDDMPTIEERKKGRAVYQAGYADGYNSAQSERKKGKWICEERKRLIDETDEGRVYITDKWWKCSECGNSKGYLNNKPDDKFCNECGADMRGTKE